MLLFFPIIFGTPLLGVLWWFWADRKLRALKNARRWRIAAGIFAATMLGGFIWVLLARRLHIAAMPPVPMLAGVYVWHLLVMPLTLMTAVVVGLVLATRKIVTKVRGRASLQNLNQNSAPSRREVITAAAAGLPPLLTAGVVGIALPQLNDFRVVERDVPVGNLPTELEGLTIAHVSDVHVGKYTKGPVLEEIVAKVNALSADLVAFTGDLIDFSMKDLPRGVEMLKAMRANYGLFMCEGNHDLFEDRPGFERQVKDAGIALLLDEAAVVNVRGRAVQMLGLRWGGGGLDFISEDLNAVMGRRRADTFPILLAHHPHAFDAAAQRGIPLTLAGHTHGGQLMLTRHAGAGPMLFRYWSGLYRKDSGASLVVSNGVGNWFPLRVGAPAEIVKLTLKRA